MVNVWKECQIENCNRNAIYINSYCQTLQSMNLTSTFELAQLAVRLQSKQPFTAGDLVVLESGVQALAGSAEANNQTIAMANRLWLLLHQMPADSYWRTMTFVINSATHPHTQTLGLSSLSKRIPLQWRHLSSQFRAYLANLLMSLEGKREAGDAMVALLRMEWQGQLGGYLAKVTGDLDNISAANLVVRLDLVGRLLREGFQTWSADFTTAEKQQFRRCVDGEVRVLLKFVYFCVREREEVEVRVGGLRLVRSIVGVVPIFQLFNCELLSAVVGLLHQKECRREAMSCLRELFSFRENEESAVQHSQIARRLFAVLEQEIGQWKPKECGNRRPVTNFDKQSASTTDSFCERETVVAGQRKTDRFANQLLELLYLYLTRYVPSMESRPHEKMLEIESDRSTKVFFSKELYDYFAVGFWAFAEFLASLEVGEMGAVGDEQAERDYQYLVSVKLTLLLYSKLGLSFEEMICKLMERLVRLAPLEQAFRKFYLMFQMLHAGEKVLLEPEEVRNYSEQYCQAYKDAMSMIAGNKSLTDLYAESVQRLLENVIRLENTQKRSVSQTINIMGVVNRVTWSLVAYFGAGGETVGLMSVTRIVGCMMQQGGSVPELQLRRCFSLNGKCLVQAYKGTQFNQILFSSLAGNAGDLVHELNIVVLSRIFLHQGFEFKDLGNRWKDNLMRMVERVLEIRQSGSYCQQFCRIYPAMFRVGMKAIQAVNGSEMERVMAGQVKEWLKRLVYAQLEASAAGLSEQSSVIDVVALKRVNLVLGSLQQVTALLLQLAKGRDKGRYWVLKHHLTALKQPLVLLEYKYKIYSDFVCDKTFENFEVAEIIEFREKFNVFVGNMAQLFVATSRIEGQEGKFNEEKRQILLRERVALISLAEGRLGQDFQAQREFKCSGYLFAAVEYYRLLALEGKLGSQQILNASVGAACAGLQQPNVMGLERLNVAKFRFWRDLVEQFTGQLYIENFDYLIRLYEGLEGLTVAGVEGCLEVIERLIQKLDGQYFREGTIPSIWVNFVSLFLITFEHIFSEMDCEEVFTRLGHILYLALLVAEQTGWKIYPREQGSKSNVEILFVKLREHIKEKVGIQGGELQQILVLLFKERKEQKFMNLLRDYRVKLLREHQKQAQGNDY